MAGSPNVIGNATPLAGAIHSTISQKSTLHEDGPLEQKRDAFQSNYRLGFVPLSTELHYIQGVRKNRASWKPTDPILTP